MNLVQVLEKMGQSSSLKQCQSIKQLLVENNQDEKLLEAALAQCEELVCLVAPEDDD